MKKVIALLVAFCLFLSWHSFWNQIIKEDCKTWIYSVYYPSDCKNGTKDCVCWYHPKRLYLWDEKGRTFLDTFINTAKREVIFSSRSKAIIKDFGDYLNEENLPKKTNNWSLSYLYSNWVPADIEDNKAAVFLITWVKLKKIPANYNDPVWYVEYYLRFFNVDNERGNYTVDPITFPVWSFWYSIWNIDNNGYINLSFVPVTNSPKKILTDPDNTVNHYEYYLLFASWCWDWVVDSSYEECDEWENNGKEWSSCDTSCKIITSSGWGWYVGDSNNACWFSDWDNFMTKPTTWLCTAWDSTAIWIDENANDGTWNWKCWNEVCYATKSCVVAWNCDTWSCWPLNLRVIDVTDTATLNKFKDPSSHYDEFCRDWSILSYSYNSQITDGKKFTWTCWNEECSAEVRFNTWVIKIYWSYSWAIWPCPECETFGGFDTEDWIRFISDYDTEYTRSIMSWDYLPFGWILKDYDTKYTGNCNSLTVWKYNKNTVKVKFKVFKYNWDLVYTTQEYNWFVWSTLTAFPDTSVNWQWYIPSYVTSNLSMWENTIKWYITYRQICKAFTDANWNTSYWWADDTWFPIEFSSQTFTVTDHYMLQLWTVLSSISNVDLRFNWKTLSDWWIESVNLPYSNYDTWALSKILWDFIKKYKTYAIWSYNLAGNITINFKKVLWQEVYYVDLSEQWWSWTIPSDFNPTIPTTVLVENWDITIDWEISWPFMLVVKNWKIKINNSKMNIQSVLEWYYITDKWFEVVWPDSTNWNILNTNPSSSRWYADGRLLVKWVLIWQNADKIYKKRRSILKNWFRQGYWPVWAIKNWGSLTITSNPNLWLNPPVWSKDLFEMLKLKKGY